MYVTTQYKILKNRPVPGRLSNSPVMCKSLKSCDVSFICDHSINKIKHSSDFHNSNWASESLGTFRVQWSEMQSKSIELKMTSDARQQRGNLRYAITYNVIWANQYTEYLSITGYAHLFEVTSFSAILSDVILSFVDTLIRYQFCDLIKHVHAARSPGLKTHNVELLRICIELVCRDLNNYNRHFFGSACVRPSVCHCDPHVFVRPDLACPVEIH